METSTVALTMRVWDEARRVDASKHRRSSPEKDGDLLRSPEFLNQPIICTAQIYPSRATIDNVSDDRVDTRQMAYGIQPSFVVPSHGNNDRSFFGNSNSGTQHLLMTRLATILDERLTCTRQVRFRIAGDRKHKSTYRAPLTVAKRRPLRTAATFCPTSRCYSPYR